MKNEKPINEVKESNIDLSNIGVDLDPRTSHTSEPQSCLGPAPFEPSLYLVAKYPNDEATTFTGYDENKGEGLPYTLVDGVEEIGKLATDADL